MEELGERLFEQISFVEASTLLTGMFLNQGTTFEFKALPDAVQQSVVMGLSVADWDGDGAEDIFVSQNLYETHLEEAPYDAGLGVLVRGDGEAGFQTVDRKDSGLSVFGAGRAAAVSDWNRDGRWDLFVARQGRAARFYQNRNSRPGVRVELVGGAQNSAAIGALLRLQGKEKNGPVQQIMGGGGDGGQDTLSRLLFLDEGIEQLWVRWPDGHETTTALPSGVRSVRVAQMERF